MGPFDPCRVGTRGWGAGCRQTRKLLAPAIYGDGGGQSAELPGTGPGGGQSMRQGTLFLPQLRQAASFCVQSAFCADPGGVGVKRRLPGEGQGQEIRAGYRQGDCMISGRTSSMCCWRITDLRSSTWAGVLPVQQVVDTVRRTGARLVGLSALMTTTLPSMEKTIAALRTAGLD